MKLPTTPLGQTAPLLACTLIAGALLTIASCATTPRSDAPTHTDRLIAAYDELGEGRFLTLSDFQTPDTFKLCQLTDVSGKARIALDARRGRRETGGGALRFTTAGDGDVLAIGGGHDPAVYMKRDWRPYDLLLMSIHSPRAGILARVGLTGMFLNREQRIESAITLDRGWNLLKIDLAELTGHLFIDDVRRIELSATGLDRPVDLLVDDLILTAHRRTIMGDSEAAPGSLYMLEVGRRWRVGVTDGFEIGFRNGQIVEWFDPPSDPTRLRNFVGAAVLGPTIVRDGGSASKGSGRTVQRTNLGDKVRATQEIVEQSALRLVIDCRLEGVAPSSDKDAPPPSESYRYTIYPSGHIYAETRSRVPTQQQSSLPGGLHFSLTSKDEAKVVTERISCDEKEGCRAAYATISTPPGGPSALLVVPTNDATEMIETWTDPLFRRLNLMARPDHRLAAVRQWSSAMRLGASDQSADEVEAEAAAMCHPPMPRVEVGRLNDRSSAQRPTDIGSADGSVSLIPHRGYLRFVLDQAWPPSMMPTYVIEGSENREATVYANHLIHNRIARDSAGRLLVQLPAGATGTRVEILLRAPDSTTP